MDREELAGLLQDLCSDNNRVQIKALVALGPHVEDRSALKSLAQPLKVRTQPGLLEKVVAFLRDDAGTAL